MLKIICPSPHLFDKKILKNYKKNFFCNFKKIDQIKFNRICHNYDVVLTRFDKNISYKKKSNIQFILSPTTGLDHIDKKFFKTKVKIINLNDKNYLSKINASTEFTIFLLLTFLKVKKNKNKLEFSKNFIGSEIKNKNVGIIGYGRIGYKMNKILKSFGARTIIYDSSEKKTKSKLNYLLKNSDVVTLHIPLNYKNKNFLNKKRLNLLKKGCIILNTSRGAVVDEKNIFEKVKKFEINYLTDVLSDKSKNTKLYKLISNQHNILVSPHVAGLTKESIYLADKFVYRQFLKIYEKS
tara:strand:+ start:3864 stop:4748 length:885 start_codon:yes stop_codon:yes gene_type:complete